jgi:DNA-binding response OmpR family regulator
MLQILIVGEDESMRKVLRLRLEDTYEIIDASSPKEALAWALEKKPDAILLDLVNPNGSGFEVCQTLISMSFPQLIPIFIISDESDSRCESLGASDYFRKPVDFDALRKRLSDVLRGKQRDRRIEPRAKLRVMLKIMGMTSRAAAFELVTPTENVSVHGFLCGCSAPLEKNAVVDVFLKATGQRFIGKARVARVEWPGTSAQRYGFRFVGDPINWVLQ